MTSACVVIVLSCFDSLSLTLRASPPHLAKDGLGPTTVNAPSGYHRRLFLAPARKRPAAEWIRRREKTAQREAVTTALQASRVDRPDTIALPQN